MSQTDLLCLLLAFHHSEVGERKNSSAAFERGGEIYITQWSDRYKCDEEFR